MCKINSVSSSLLSKNCNNIRRNTIQIIRLLLHTFEVSLLWSNGLNTFLPDPGTLSFKQVTLSIAICLINKVKSI